jgi:LysR family hydrogen peroxide-inducible transcriptional activator
MSTCPSRDGRPGSALAVATEAGRAGLVVRRLADPAPRRTIALVWRRRSPLAPALRQIAATLRDVYPAPRGR